MMKPKRGRTMVGAVLAAMALLIVVAASVASSRGDVETAAAPADTQPEVIPAAHAGRGPEQPSPTASASATSSVAASASASATPKAKTETVEPSKATPARPAAAAPKPATAPDDESDLFDERY